MGARRVFRAGENVTEFDRCSRTAERAQLRDRRSTRGVRSKSAQLGPSSVSE